MRNRCLPIMFLATFFALRAVAWGPTGHRVVGEIAQRHLKPRARDAVARLLGGYSLAEVANWADDLRSDPRFDRHGGQGRNLNRAASQAFDVEAQKELDRFERNAGAAFTQSFVAAASFERVIAAPRS